ncbi:stage II sporulation protein B [Anoxybacillus calidus]|jgi:stage II sporulation protein B|uniref:Stage II sporulation protein B n=1 Tax=[Anoxybacillus] calidus TaxID=575178 RepID=A0A7W0BX28_9BACL|nr:SPOR domain-containing protein [Anoxybacillus calidus]MBA2871614.1 stage II sporulation protein B [Anoxybacillus calidus]
MDKQGNKISIKINGSERSFTAKETVIPKPVTEPVKNEICAAKEEEKELLFENVKSKEENERHMIDFTGLRKLAARPIKKKSFNSTVSKHIKSAFVSIFTAVAIGTSFGFVVLNFLSEDRANGTPKEEGVSSSSALLSSHTETKELAANSAQQLSFSVYVVQAGVFSTLESAKEYRKKLNDAGIPAVVVGESPTYLFIGIGLEKEALYPVSELYKQKGQETYIKPLTLATADNSKAQKMLAASQSFYEKLISASAQLLGGNSLTSEIRGDLQNEYKQFQTIQVPSDKNAVEYKKHLESAYALLTSYQQTKDAQSLLKIQQKLLEALTFYMAFTSK